MQPFLEQALPFEAVPARPFQLGRAVRRILQIGVGSSILDLGTVILAILMNNQIMRYGGATELSVYGVAATIASLFQALFCGVGQAVQPLVSANFGAGKTERIRSVLRMSMLTVLVMGVLFTALGELLPVQITRPRPRSTGFIFCCSRRWA